MSLLYETEPKVVESGGVKCYVREASSDEMVFHENIVNPQVSERLTVEPGQFWLDLGGFIGTFALYVMKHGGKVMSVEADPANAERYLKNMELNGISPPPKLISAAIMQEPPPEGKVHLHLPIAHSGEIKAGGIKKRGVTNHALNSIHSRWKRPHPTKEVNTIAYDDVIQEVVEKYGKDHTLCLKADMEGAEVDILERGDLSMFKQIFFEYHYQAGGGPERAAEVFDRIRGLGFELKLNREPRPGVKPWWNQTFHLGWAWRE